VIKGFLCALGGLCGKVFGSGLAEMDELTFQDLLHDEAVVDFCRRLITQSYQECTPGYAAPMRALLDEAFTRLLASRGDAAAVQMAAVELARDVFCKGVTSFWFNRFYNHYKQALKPQMRLKQLQPWLAGQRVLDLGCGDGLTSLALAAAGCQPLLTDVLDYRHPSARALPFAAMGAGGRIPFPDGAADTAIVLAVLHHAQDGLLRPLLAELRRTSRRVIVEEDSYDLPPEMPGLAEALAGDAWLREFTARPADEQRRLLMFIDYFANAITMGLPQMNIPFNFKTVSEWQALFTAQGWQVTKTLVLGFQPEHFNRSCHVMFIIDVE
jgi:SAM-dependent methyltransferase